MIAFPGRGRRLARIRRLDPGRDHEQIYRMMVREEFKADALIGLLLAFWREFGIPDIAGLLAATGEMVDRTRKRADDTAILMYELFDHGFEHPRGRLAVRQINQIHRRFGDAITPDGNLYVLGSLVVVPTRWIDRHGWRPLCCHERAATHAFYRELGRRMNIADIPETYEAFEMWFDDYERRHMAYTEAGRRLIDATRDIFGELPGPLSLAGRSFVDAVLLDPALRAATGVPEPDRRTVRRWGAVLAVRSRLQRLAPPRRPYHRAGVPKTSTYPDGYEITQVGPAD